MALSERGKQVRRDTILLSEAHGGYHYGGCFSCVEILTTLYDTVMGPNDLFILSKGHSCWPWYVILRERGLNPKLQGHPTRDPANGIPASTGSLGHGLPLAVGMAAARKLTGAPGTIYVLLGDGECQEGTTWEAMLIAARLGLGNLVAVIDRNGIQGSDHVHNTLPLPDMVEMGKSLGWGAQRVSGHSEKALASVLAPANTDRPRLVVAETVKGKGVSFMEGKPEWHANWLGGEQREKAMEELI